MLLLKKCVHGDTPSFVVRGGTRERERERARRRGRRGSDGNDLFSTNSRKEIGVNKNNNKKQINIIIISSTKRAADDATVPTAERKAPTTRRRHTEFSRSRKRAITKKTMTDGRTPRYRRKRVFHRTWRHRVLYARAVVVLAVTQP